MFWGIGCSRRIGKVSQAKYGQSGCEGFYFLLVHRPVLEVCSDPYLDSLFHMNCNFTAKSFWGYSKVPLWWLFVGLPLLMNNTWAVLHPSIPPQVDQNIFHSEAERLSGVRGQSVLRMVSGGQHNILSHPNEHHIWFGVLVSCKVRPQWRGETEATCRTGSARLPVTSSPPSAWPGWCLPG